MPALKWLKKSKSIKDSKKKARKKNKIKFNKLVSIIKALLLLGLVTLLIISAIVIFSSNFFKVKQIICKKDDYPCTDFEKQFLDEYKNKNIFLINLQEIENKIIRNFSEISRIEAQKKLPDQVSISFYYRKPLVQVSQNEKVWYLVDSNGLVYKKIYNKDNNLPQIILRNGDFNIILGKTIANKNFNQVLIMVKELNNNYVLFREIIYYSLGKMSVDLHDGVIATFSMNKDLAKQVDSLQLILRQSKIEGKLPKTIDLRFTKPVVKF